MAGRPGVSVLSFPPCVDDTDSWQRWVELRSGAYSQCEDCQPTYREKMLAAGRCNRPETVFVVDGRGFEVVGISADDPGYARVLRGQSLGKHVEPMGRWPVLTEAWAELLRSVRDRAHREVRRAIDEWLRTFERRTA